jgi:hypothetical protein
MVLISNDQQPMSLVGIMRDEYGWNKNVLEGHANTHPVRGKAVDNE